MGKKIDFVILSPFFVHFGCVISHFEAFLMIFRFSPKIFRKNVILTEKWANRVFQNRFSSIYLYFLKDFIWKKIPYLKNDNNLCLLLRWITLRFGPIKNLTVTTAEGPSHSRVEFDEALLALWRPFMGKSNSENAVSKVACK